MPVKLYMTYTACAFPAEAGSALAVGSSKSCEEVSAGLLQRGHHQPLMCAGRLGPNISNVPTFPRNHTPGDEVNILLVR
jgi:hypothetical protein